MRFSLFTATVLLAASAAASGQTTWFVDNIHGDDTNPGTSATTASRPSMSRHGMVLAATCGTCGT